MLLNSAFSQALLFGSLIVLASWAGAAETAGYSNYMKQVNERVVLAGVLDLEALRAAHDGEILIVDLRTEAEGTPLEAAQADELGLGYTNIPVSSASVNPVQLEELTAVLAGSSAPLVVVHCASGNRAGMLWGAAELAGGRSLEEVRSDVAGILTKQPTIDGLEAFAETLDAQP